MMEPILSVQDVSKVFGLSAQSFLADLPADYDKAKVFRKSRHTVAIYRANFDIKEGELFAIIGLSGSGKSTLVRCLNRLTRPTAGKILFRGDNIMAYNAEQLTRYRRNHISMVFQSFGLLTHRNVIENVAFGPEIKKAPREERLEEAKKALAMVGLEGWEQSAIHNLSGGMKQRVGLARALNNDPDILLMDEPFSALDPIVRRDMQFELLNLQKTLKKTIVFITHDINEAFKLGDRIAIMKDGRIVQIDTPENILKNPADDYVSTFVQDIDRTRILSARNIMVRPTALAFSHSGPHIAIKEMRSEGLSSVFVVDDNMKLQGLITLDSAMEAINQGKTTLEDSIIRDVLTTEPDTSVSQLLQMATETRYPISVIDAQGRLQGIITRVAVMSALIS